MIGGKTTALPKPTLCPGCRLQRLQSFCNERTLYHRKCDLTGKQIISIYHPDSPFTIYNQKEWYEQSGWDPHSYGREMDFNRSFFEQFAELLRAVPHPALITDYQKNENSEFTNFTGSLKNCYLIFHADFNEDCLYGYGIKKCLRCVDCTRILECELCYECVDCTRCYDLRFSKDCINCSSSIFLDDCIGCKNCFGCSGLRNKEYHINNQPYSKDQYGRYLEQFRLSSHASLLSLKSKAQEFRLQSPKKALHMTNAEGSLGDYLIDCKNAGHCYDCSDLEDCQYCYQVSLRAKDCSDLYQFGINAELCYDNTMIGYDVQRVLFSFSITVNCSDVLYSMFCHNGCSNLFGCVGLNRKKYCILNKEYSREDYETLVPKIIDRMRQAKEWGEFFPSSISPFGYNETTAQEYTPLTEQQAMAHGWNWRKETDEAQSYLGPRVEIPDSIKDVSDEITKQILHCEVTGKPYKIIPQELEFYRDMSLPIPRRSPDQRHKERMAQRNPRTLWDRQCATCGKAIKTTYAPDRLETVYCEECYLSAVY